MAVSVVEQQLRMRLRTRATAEAEGWRAGAVLVMHEAAPGVWRHWWLPVPVLLDIAPSGAPGVAGAGGAVGSAEAAGPDPEDQVSPTWAGPAGPQGRLREALAEVGLDAQAVELFAVAAVTAGTLQAGRDLSQVAVSGPGAQDSAGGDEAGGDQAVGAGVDVARPAHDGVGAADLRSRTASASHVLGLVGALTSLSAKLDGVLVGVVADLTVRTGRVLLAGKGVADPGELSQDQARRWRARAKSLTRAEIEALTGWGAGEVSDLVALAAAPALVQAPVVASMRTGVTPWRLARRFLRELGHQPHEDAAEVAERLFGTDPETVCTDRLDPEGVVKVGPWEHRLFHRALAAEVTRLASRDPHAAAQARAAARRRRDVRVAVHDDGTGTVSVAGTAAQVGAVADRLERAARAARAQGDERTLADLRADLAMSLLMHSTLALPDPPPADADDVVRTTWSEQMRAVLAALPPAVLNVIVPFDALVHSPGRPLPWSTMPRHDQAAGKPTTAQPGAVAGTGPPGRPRPPGQTPPPGEGDEPTEVLSLGMVTGAFPQFLTPDAVRELALTPGTTLHRLLTDPADGRCVERSIAAYTPDAAMRAQVHAADVTCRAPGCAQHAPYTQLDHVHPHGQGGPTSETNLQALHTRHHDAKTHGGWQAVMTSDRDVTWTSLLGRIYRTRAHDHRQYSTLYRAAVRQVHAEAEQALADEATAHSRARAEGTGGGVDGRGEPRPQERLTRQAAVADAVDRAVYRALTYRPPARALRAGDDYPDTDTDPAFLGWDSLTLTHTTPDGHRRHGPDPVTAAAERDAQHATDPPPARAAGEDTDPDTRQRTGRHHDVAHEPPPF